MGITCDAQGRVLLLKDERAEWKLPGGRLEIARSASKCLQWACPGIVVGWSACSAVLVDQVGDCLSAREPGWRQGDYVRVVVGRELVPALVGPMAVEVTGVLVEDPLRVSTVEDQQAVGALLAYGADEPLRVGVAVGALWRDLGRGDALAAEDRIEGVSEFRVPVPDQVAEVGRALAELPQQLAGLLGSPGGGGVGVTPRMWTVRV